MDVDLVIPTVGRSSLHDLLGSLAAAAAAGGPLPPRVVLCDDRPTPAADGPLLASPPPSELVDRLVVVPTGGRGPAAARNAGWQATSSPWVVFVDDDVVLPSAWLTALADDLRDLPPAVGASQGRIEVPLPTDRRPTDWERNVAGLESACWATADMAYRRSALEAVGGFDERFPRAYREDADLGLRVVAAGFRIVRGERHILHPVRPADDAVSIRMQAGNADDPLMRALHGPGWRRRAGVPRGRRPWHLVTVAAAATAVTATLLGRRRPAVAAGSAWLALTADLTVRRIAPGPRTRDEVVRMLWTSLVLPLAATRHWLRGLTTLRRRLAASGPTPGPTPPGAARPSDAAHVLALADRASGPAAVLFDRDGTLIHDVPYNGDPDLVAPVEGAREALARLRALGVPTAVISNQSGIARGWLTHAQVDAVNARVADLLGPLGPVLVCPHGPTDGCGCRKPAPGLVIAAARALHVDPARCVVIGDIAADVAAAAAVGARGILVPTAVTRAEEVAAADEVAEDLGAAVEIALRPARPTRRVG